MMASLFNNICLLKTLLPLLLCFVASGMLHAQCVPSTSNCMAPPNSEIVMTTPATIDFTFDQFSQYKGGITFNGSSILKIKAQDNPGFACKWKLIMIVQTMAASGAEWETTVPYSNISGTKPPLDLLEIRVSNQCGTPIKNMQFQHFDNTNYAVLEIIDDNVLNASGACNGTQVNSAGSYLSNYGEYVFNIDYRIKPNTTFTPGRYQIGVKFCLTE